MVQEKLALDIKNMSWVENTSNEVDYLIELCGLRGNERILDLACGYGRHALEFARRGYEVVGVDITKAYIEDAKKSAKEMGLRHVSFICGDIRDVDFQHTFLTVSRNRPDRLRFPAYQCAYS